MIARHRYVRLGVQMKPALAIVVKGQQHGVHFSLRRKCAKAHHLHDPDSFQLKDTNGLRLLLMQRRDATAEDWTTPTTTSYHSRKHVRMGTYSHELTNVSSCILPATGMIPRLTPRSTGPRLQEVPSKAAAAALHLTDQEIRKMRKRLRQRE